MRPWWHQPKGSVNATVVRYVSEVERQQSDIFERFVRLAFLYDPSDNGYQGSRRGPDSRVSENVIASNVDTVAAAISATKVRAQFMTDDADWSTQRRAKKLGWYSDKLVKKYKVHKQARRGFREGALKGTGLVKVYADRFKQIQVERVLVDDIISTAGSLVEAARLIVKEGGKRVLACATHGILAGPALDRLKDSPIDKLVITDTISPELSSPQANIEVLTVSGDLWEPTWLTSTAGFLS